MHIGNEILYLCKGGRCEEGLKNAAIDITRTPPNLTGIRQRQRIGHSI